MQQNPSEVQITWLFPSIKGKAVSLLPHFSKKQPKTAAFCVKNKKRDTKGIHLLKSFIKVRPPSEPKLVTDNPKKYYITWNHDVPVVLWPKYPRRRKQIKVYDDINRFKGEERDQYAAGRLAVWKYAVKELKYNPFDEELIKYYELSGQKEILIEKIAEKEKVEEMAAQLPDEDKRKLVSIEDALREFIQSRIDRKLEPESISSYEGTAAWILEGLKAKDYLDIPIGQVRHIHLSAAISWVADDREWVATTINKEVGFLMTIFNWLQTEEYIIKNPSAGKFIKLPENKTKHKWYDPILKKKVIDAIKEANNIPLLRACEFTYWTMIRSKKELRKLQVGDIDRTLKRIRFTADLSKNKTEVYRDYEPELELILAEMKLEQYPPHYFVFGSKDGSPGDTMCGHNYFSRMYRVIKDKLGLSIDYTIYGFKHTRIVHLLMKKVDGYEISHKARHTERRSTQDYMRDYDITLKHIYGPEDLTF